jgi:hypothetical protein
MPEKFALFLYKGKFYPVSDFEISDLPRRQGGYFYPLQKISIKIPK